MLNLFLAVMNQGEDKSFNEAILGCKVNNQAIKGEPHFVLVKNIAEAAMGEWSCELDFDWDFQKAK